MDLNKNPDTSHNEKLYQFYINDTERNKLEYQFKKNID